MHEKIRQAILERMKEKGISYADLENMTGVSRSSIQRYVAGKTSKIPYDRIIKILKALAIDPGIFAVYASTDKLSTYFANGGEMPPKRKFVPDENWKRWEINWGHETDPLPDDETMKLAEELRNRPGMRMLFDAAKNCNEEDLRNVADFISKYRKGDDD